MAKTKSITKIVKVQVKNPISINNLIGYLQTQLSDGYWENDENYYDEFWKYIKITTKATEDTDKKPIEVHINTHPHYINNNNKFLKMSTSELINYIRNVVKNCYDDADWLFDSHFDNMEELIDDLSTCVEYLDTLPKITHLKLVQLVGHDFIYVKD